MQKKKFDDYCSELRRRIADENDVLSKLDAKEKKLILDTTKESLDWIKKNPNASKKDIEEKFTTTKEKLDPIIQRAETRGDLINYAKALRSRANDDDISSKLSDKERKTVEKEVAEVLDFIDKNYNATNEELAKKQEKLTNNVKPVIDRAEALIKLENYANNIMNRVLDSDDLGNQLPEKEKKRIIEECSKVLDWIDENPNSNVEDIIKKHKELIDKVGKQISDAEARKMLEKRLAEVKNRLNNDDKLTSKLTKSEKKIN